MDAATTKRTTGSYYRIALALAVFTIVYNLLEGLVSVYFGYKDETLVLFGFGMDSFIETISGLGVLFMVLRIMRDGVSKRAQFEKLALRITGGSFYVLAAGLVFSGAYNFYTQQKPETTIVGVIISLISILIMLLLVYGKTTVGNALNSDAIIADAACTKVCIYMSVILLASSLLYTIVPWGGFDAIGALGLAWFSLQEGRECFEKTKKDIYCSCNH